MRWAKKLYPSFFLRLLLVILGMEFGVFTPKDDPSDACNGEHAYGNIACDQLYHGELVVKRV